MDKNKQIESNAVEIDVLHIAKALWHRAWLILIVAVLCGAIAFCYAAFFITPQYSSSIMLYINSKGLDIGSSSLGISLSDLNTSTRLVSTYSVILQNRTTLERVAQSTGLDYTWKQLDNMISTASVNDTEVMRVTVTCDDPQMAAKIANGIAVVLPNRVTEVVNGSSMEVLDSAVAQYTKVSPSLSRYTIIGMLVGLLISGGIVALLAILDNTIHDEEFVTSNFDLPILAKIPNLTADTQKKYGYYYRYNSYRKN